MIFPQETLVGQTYNSWTVVDFVGRDANSNQLYKCRCSCGFENVIRKSTLIAGESAMCRNCRAKKRLESKLDIVGKKIGSCTVIKRLDNLKDQSYYLIRCDCGNEKTAFGYRLRAGKSTACPHCRIKTHGMSYTSTYKIWTGMLRRCTNKNFKAYKYYGGRGITVCDRWLEFDNFLEDMGIRPDNLQIDRINNDGNYEPGNCRWVTAKVNNSNRNILKNKKGN
jgi:hypothetical protein